MIASCFFDCMVITIFVNLDSSFGNQPNSISLFAKTDQHHGTIQEFGMANKFNHLKSYLNKISPKEHSNVIKMLATIGLNTLLQDLQATSSSSSRSTSALSDLKIYFGNSSFLAHSHSIFSYYVLVLHF